MGYKKNPFNSTKGQELMKDIFNLMFISPERKPSQVESGNKQRQISHYKGNIINIVNKMRKFVVGYQQVAVSESQSSGILVCPHCARHDPIWMWETVDAGHYSSPKDWTNSVSLQEWRQGFANEKNKFLFMVRYRCNHVTTCQDCGVSVAGHYDSCKDCGSSNVAKVGCLEESYGTHYLREYTADDNHPQEDIEATGAKARNTMIRDPKNRRNLLQGRLTGYKFVHNQVPKGKVVKSWSDIKEYTPSVEMTYTHKGTGATKINTYPISQLNYAISKQQMRTCFNGRDTGNGNLYHEGSKYDLKDSYNRPTDECPACGATDYPPLFDVMNVFYAPETMRIMNPQPLDASTGSGGTFKGLPVYTLYLESTGNPDYKLLLPMPQYNNLRKIPTEPKLESSGGSGTMSCQNDVGGQEEEIENVAELNEQLIEDFKKNLSAELGQKTDGESNQGYTFVVCEGRSREAYYDFSLAKWIDNSPPCYSYRDPTNGSTLKTKREYPRWTEIPSYSPNALPNTDFLQYQGPNLDTHLVQDSVLAKTNQALSVPMESAINYHSVVKIADRIDEEQGLIFEVYECRTCKGIVEAGGIIPYRMKLGQCDVDGKVLDKKGFSQAVLDAEIGYEKSFPMQDVYGNPVPTAWGLIADSEHNGKKMLENPDLNIRIG